jgi:hypothetical protein
MLYVQASAEQAGIWERLLRSQEASGAGADSAMAVNKTYAEYVRQRSEMFQKDIHGRVPLNVF